MKERVWLKPMRNEYYFPPAEAGGNSKAGAIQKWRQLKAGSNSMLGKIQSWRQSKNGGNSENIVWVEFMNLELPQASACG